MNQRELQAWIHIRSRASECMTYYDDYPGLQDLLNKDLKIIQDLLTNEKEQPNEKR